MKVTNGDIYGARDSFRHIIDQKLPVAVSSKVATIAIKCNEQLQVIELVRQGLVKKYGRQEKDGAAVTVRQDSAEFPAFVQEFNELMGQEVELSAEVVKLTGLTFDIEPSALMALHKFIEV